jgi:hypothetical protein
MVLCRTHENAVDLHSVGAVAQEIATEVRLKTGSAQKLCYFKVQQLYTVKHNTSDINKNTLHWRHVSAHIVAIFRPYANLERARITALGCRRHLLSTSVIKILVKSCGLSIGNH